MRRALVLGLSGLLLASELSAREPVPTGSPATAGYQPIGKDEQGLWAEIEEGERSLKTSKFLVKDPSVLAYIRKVLCRAVGEEGCASARIYLVRDPEPNASMAPNGLLKIQTGILLRLQNEAQLAAVLAHEYTHFEHRHTLARWKSMRNAGSLATWFTVLSIGVGSPANYAPIFFSAHYAFQRDQERDADLTGLELMARNGYVTKAAGEFWAQSQAEDDARAASLKVKSLKNAYRGSFSTHPLDAERMAYLQERAQHVGAGNTFTGADEYRVALAPIWPMLVDDQIKLNDFGGSEFLLTHLAAAGWTGPLLYARAELYRLRGATGDMDRAIAVYRQSLETPDAPDAAWRGLALALARTSDRAGASAAVQEYLKRNPAAADRMMLTSIAGVN